MANHVVRSPFYTATRLPEHTPSPTDKCLAEIFKPIKFMVLHAKFTKAINSIVCPPRWCFFNTTQKGHKNMRFLCPLQHKALLVQHYMMERKNYTASIRCGNLR